MLDIPLLPGEYGVDADVFLVGVLLHPVPEGLLQGGVGPEVHDLPAGYQELPVPEVRVAFSIEREKDLPRVPEVVDEAVPPGRPFGTVD